MSLIVGLGSPHGDDQLGWIAIDRLRPQLPAGISAQKVRDGFELLDSLEGHDSAFIIDAAAPAGQPGTCRSFNWPSPLLADGERLTTHSLGLVAALQLAEVLNCLPHRLIIYTIEADDTSPGAPLSNLIAHQLDLLVESLCAELAARH